VKPDPERRAARRGTSTFALLIACAAIAACSSARALQGAATTTSVRTPTSAPTTTEAPTTDAPTPEVPTIDAPTTDAPTTDAPTTEPPATEPPQTDPPSTAPSPPDPPADSVVPPPGDVIGLRTLDAAFGYLVPPNAAVSLSVWRDHEKIYGRASGTTAGGMPMTSDSPLVLASVSKLITALTVARLAEANRIDVFAPVPWDQLFIAHDPAWDDVTVRELLDHTGGMPKAQNSWLNQPGSCAVPLGEALALPPTVTRGKWTYSNGNYCALGLLIESVTDESRDLAADDLVFDPIDVTGPHLTTDGLLSTDGPYAEGVARLERLGGAGTWLASTDDLAAMLDSVTADDRAVLRSPGIITDQYGWGHTGTVDGAKSCAWVMEDGRTIVVATVAGNKPSTGGKVCDAVVPALATDLGIWAGDPVRFPD
jgi:CubicO group peptidase (beta-lactamase class C family)